MNDLVLSLFPGIGMLDYAFELEGVCTARGPDRIWGGDIRTYHPPAGKFDGVIGGPPCQAFSSLAHLVRANGHEPKFGNLIPEFERCVSEAAPAWFLMENVPQAPVPIVAGYGVMSFLLDNSALDSGDGWGHEQRRVRRFSFGMRGVDRPPDLRQWIDLAVFVLPDAERCATQGQVNNSDEAKGRTRSRAVTALGPDHLQGLRDSTNEHRTRRQAVLSDPSAVPVKIGGSGKVKRTRQVAVTSTDGGERPSERKRVSPITAAHMQPDALTERKRQKAVSSSNGGNGAGEFGRETAGAGNNDKGRYRLADACRLQGLPEDFLKDAPFTAEGKLKAVANGVPIAMGRAIARAIKEVTR